MLIIGAKGFAKEVLEVCHQNNNLKNLVFFDDVNQDIGEKLYSRFPILKNEKEVLEYFKTCDNKFSIGIGSPTLRKMVYEKFKLLGGEVVSTISTTAQIGSFNTVIEEGCNIMQSAMITNDILIKKGGIINQLSSIGHNVVIGEFCEICPGVSISGECLIGSGTFIGTNATILPNIKIGSNVIVAAGALVAKNVPDNCMVAGVPATIKKRY